MVYNFDRLDEIRKFFTDKGFKEFTPPDFRSYDGVTTMFQKRYDDDLGKKYFIDVKIWDWTGTYKIPENYSVEFEGQYYQKDTHNAVNFTFIDWKLEDVESWLDKLFEVGLIEHYELW